MENRVVRILSQVHFEKELIFELSREFKRRCGSSSSFQEKENEIKKKKKNTLQKRVHSAGIEPATVNLEGCCSIQLS